MEEDDGFLSHSLAPKAETGIRRKEDDDAEIPWVKTATLLAGAIFGEVEAGRGRGKMGFSGVLMLTFCQSGTVLT